MHHSASPQEKAVTFDPDQLAGCVSSALWFIERSSFKYFWVFSSPKHLFVQLYDENNKNNLIIDDRTIRKRQVLFHQRSQLWHGNIEQLSILFTPASALRVTTGQKRHTSDKNGLKLFFFIAKLNMASDLIACVYK